MKPIIKPTTLAGKDFGRASAAGLTAIPGAIRSAGRTDFSGALGLAGALLLIMAAIAAGGSLRPFLDLPSALIVIGGTLTVTAMGQPVAELWRAQKVIFRTMFHTAGEPAALADLVLGLVELARKSGPLSLQPLLPQLTRQEYLRRALTLVIDGTAPEEIEQILTREMHARVDRHARVAGLVHRAADIAPTMGLIGTLVGLVQMLANLDNPGAIGPAMAVALITTFYGAILGNVVFSPLAAKLERNSAEENMIEMLAKTGAVAIARQDNPRRVARALNALLSPAQRLSRFD
jgi:chemotaxis protein MotA